MKNFAVILFEPGMPESVPGIKKNIASLVFPFWGDYNFIDCHLSNFAGYPQIPVLIMFLEKQKSLAAKITSLIKKDTVKIVVLENGIHSLITELNELDVEDFIFLSGSHIAFFETSYLLENDLLSSHDSVKISIRNIPLEFYLIKSRTFTSYLENNLNPNQEDVDLIEYLFDNVFHPLTEKIVDIPGTVFFHNNLLQFYQSNLWIINNQFSKEFLKLISFTATSVLNQNVLNSYIGNGGYIKNSFLGSGVEIHGIIDNSVIFSNVIIRENTIVKNSVIMNNNRIGKNCTVQNTIILPFFDEMQNNYYNINDNVQIGGKLSNIKNNTFPDQIFDGISMIGINVVIPKNFVIEHGCCVGSDISEKEIRRMERLKKGTCLM